MRRDEDHRRAHAGASQKFVKIESTSRPEMDVENQTGRPMATLIPEKIVGGAEPLHGVTKGTEQPIQCAPDGDIVVDDAYQT